jgi:hypothetical protein
MERNTDSIFIDGVFPSVFKLKPELINKPQVPFFIIETEGVVFFRVSIALKEYDFNLSLEWFNFRLC